MLNLIEVKLFETGTFLFPPHQLKEILHRGTG